MRLTYLAAYDRELRTDAEVTHALSVAMHGPLRLAVFPGGRGFVSYSDLDGHDSGGIEELIDVALAHFTTLSGIDSIEWKTRGHDRAPGLGRALVSRGFVPEDEESVMIGEAAALAQPVDLPSEVELRRARTEAEVFAMEEMQGRVFGDPQWRVRVETTLQRIREDDTVELWTAVADGAVISAGRLEPVAGTRFAGLWGGATLPEWRGRGIYRALTAERARSALALGKRYLQSDCTEFSRPILERAGLVKVSTTTPYVWTRPAD